MKILSIDTTAMRGSFALSDGSSCVAQIQQPNPDTHSAKLMASFDSLISDSGWKLDDLEGIAVAVGPGSFTGLRIGLAAAKGIAISLDIPIAGVSSLRSLSLNGDSSKKNILSLIDARRGELYAALWDRESDTALIDECVVPPEKLIERLSSIDATFYAVGDGAIQYGDLLKESLDDKIEIAGELELLPKAHNLALLSQEILEKGGDDLAKLVPNYVRQSDAEIGFPG